MESLIGRIKSTFCSDCKIGKAYAVLQYASPGCSIDYAYTTVKVPFTFVFEIFRFPEMRFKALKNRKNLKKVNKNNKRRLLK